MTAFGPQLIGQTEKALTALLTELLAGEQLGEPEWVTLRLAAQAPPGEDLAAHVRDRAPYADAGALVAALTARGLLADGRPTAAGRELMGRVGTRIQERTAPVWAAVNPADAAAAERALTVVLDGTRAILGADAPARAPRP